MNTNIIVGAIVVGGIIALIFLSGEKQSDATTPRDATAEESLPTDEVLDVSMPADMPSHVPIYPGSRVTAVQENEHEGVRDITLTLSAEASVSEVNGWYRGALQENGWAVVSDKNVGGYVILKGQHETIATFTQVANATDPGKVTITQRIQMR